jgi:hypothetical protein
VETDGAAGVAEAGDAGGTGFAAGTAAAGEATATGGLADAGAAGAAATGAGAVGAVRVRAAFAAASFAWDSAFEADSAADSSSEAPLIFARTFTATSSGMELE